MESPSGSVDLSSSIHNTGGISAATLTSTTSNPTDAGDDDFSHLTVENWLRAHLDRLVKAGEDAVDDAVDSLNLSHKAAREELRNWQHQRAAEQAFKRGVARRVAWDVVLTIEAAGGDGGEAAIGRTFTLKPRQHEGGMARIGRSTGADFCEPRGVSLPFDASISVWHGKFTAVYGQIFFSDLNTRNGSVHNG
jgi:hypothetical protein